MRILALLLSTLLIVPNISWAEASKAEQSPEEEPDVEYNSIVMQGLNKVTGHILKFEGDIGTPVRFGNLEITGKRCWKAPPDEQPENAALIEITELRPDEAPKQIFLGWMFSSSPGLSGLEHPVYDISILNCEIKKPEKTEPQEEPKQEKPKVEEKKQKKDKKSKKK